jgi:hypothetical protein
MTFVESMEGDTKGGDSRHTGEDGAELEMSKRSNEKENNDSSSVNTESLFSACP